MGWQAAVWGLPLAPQSPSTSQGTLKSTSILTAQPRDAAGSIPTDFRVCPAGGQWAGTSEQKPIQLGKKKKTLSTGSLYPLSVRVTHAV